MYYAKIKANPVLELDNLPSINVEVQEDKEPVAAIEVLLQIALTGEYQQWDLYTAYASRLKGTERGAVADEFAAHAEEELGHIDLIQRYLVSLGTNPTVERKPIPELGENATMKDIVALQLKFERDAVALYEKILHVLPDNEALKLDIEAVLTKEQEHVHDLELLLGSEVVEAKASKKRVPKQGDVDYLKHKIAIDTLRFPHKVLGKPSLDDAKEMLKKHFGYSDEDLKKLTVKAYFRPEEPGEPTKPQAGYGQCGCGCLNCTCAPQSFLLKVDQKWCADALKALAPDIYARWYQGKLLTAQEKDFVAKAISLKWNLRDQRAILRMLENTI